MTTQNPVLRIIEVNGPSTTARELSQDEVIDMAKGLLAARCSRNTEISSAKDVKDYLLTALGAQEQEVFAGMFLDQRHRLISFDILFYGTLGGAAVYPREVVKRAFLYNAAAVIFAHNHPSGVAEPSRADELLTKRLAEALQLIEVRVLDHIVVAGGGTVSFAERGLL
jgi:DNA repair protein RadC